MNTNSIARVGSTAVALLVTVAAAAASVYGFGWGKPQLGAAGAVMAAAGVIGLYLSFASRREGDS